MVSNVESSKSGTRSKRKTSMKFMKVKKEVYHRMPAYRSVSKETTLKTIDQIFQLTR